jgi:hypothetical protein
MNGPRPDDAAPAPRPLTTEQQVAFDAISAAVQACVKREMEKEAALAAREAAAAGGAGDHGDDSAGPDPAAQSGPTRRVKRG